MTKQIYKYTLTGPFTEIEMPEESDILSAQVDGHDIFVYALVDSNKPLQKRWIVSINTGKPITFDEILRPVYIGTVRVEEVVWHVFETFWRP